MHCLVVFLCFVLRFILAQDDTLQHVTLEWKFSRGGDSATSYAGLSNDLSEHLPEISLSVSGVMPSIHAGIFRNIEKLSSLTISDVGLKEIQAGAFRDLPHLLYIECNNNSLSEIRSGIFVDLDLTDLHLENGKIKFLEKGAFRNLTQLQRLVLKNNQLEEIGKEVFDNISPFRLDLSENFISTLEPGVFEKIHGAEGFYLTVNLYSNKLKEINPEVFSHDAIITLELANNKISQLRPGDLKNVPILQTLLLSNNEIKSISDNAFPATIETLDLSNNQISHISSHAFDGIHILKYINLKHNQLTKWDPDWFPGLLTGDTELYASYNHIEEIPDDAFRNNPEISRIDLGKNRIRKISAGAFKSLRKVQMLSLNDNEIEEWDEMILGTRDNLTIAKMNLKRNCFRCFRGDLREIFKNVEAAWIDQNPISADCSGKVEEFKKGIKVDEFDEVFYDGSW